MVTAAAKVAQAQRRAQAFSIATGMHPEVAWRVLTAPEFRVDWSTSRVVVQDPPFCDEFAYSGDAAWTQVTAEVWERFEARGFLPTGAGHAGARRYGRCGTACATAYEPCQCTGDEAPSSIAAALAFAGVGAEAWGVPSAEALVREFAGRLAPWGAADPTAFRWVCHERPTRVDLSLRGRRIDVATRRVVWERGHHTYCFDGSPPTGECVRWFARQLDIPLTDTRDILAPLRELFDLDVWLIELGKGHASVACPPFELSRP